MCSFSSGIYAGSAFSGRRFLAQTGKFHRPSVAMQRAAFTASRMLRVNAQRANINWYVNDVPSMFLAL